jgi:hypothetical protein
MITIRKKTNTKFNIFLTWKKAELIFFNSNLIFGKFLTVKKYISEPQTPLIKISIISAEFSFQIIILITEFLNCLMIPADQVTVINGIIIIRFLIGNSLIIQKMINKFNI